MRYRTLGATGIQVSELCLGTMMLGGWGNADRGDCVRIVRRALDAGVNFVDTADRYAIGESEEIVAEALRGRRDDVVLVTKFGNPMGSDANARGASRRYVVRALEASLRRLGTDHVDVYLLHRPDPRTGLEETLDVLSDLVRGGKIRAFGTSNLPAHEHVRAAQLSAAGGYERIRVEQPPYSLFVRSVERELLPACARYGVGVMTYAPLNNGWLTGKYRLDAAPPSDGRLVRLTGWDPDAPAARAKLDLVGSLGELAQAGGVSMVHLAHAWALRHPAVSSVIMGPRTMEQLDSALGAVDVELPPDLLDRIDALVPAGSDVDPAEATWTLGSLEPAARRRGSAERDVFEVPEGDWRRPGAR